MMSSSTESGGRRGLGKGRAGGVPSMTWGVSDSSCPEEVSYGRSSGPTRMSSESEALEVSDDDDVSALTDDVNDVGELQDYEPPEFVNYRITEDGCSIQSSKPKEASASTSGAARAAGATLEWASGYALSPGATRSPLVLSLTSLFERLSFSASLQERRSFAWRVCRILETAAATPETTSVVARAVAIMDCFMSTESDGGLRERRQDAFQAADPSESLPSAFLETLETSLQLDARHATLRVMRDARRMLAHPGDAPVGFFGHFIARPRGVAIFQTVSSLKCRVSPLFVL